jgi:hypothetical protein
MIIIYPTVAEKQNDATNGLTLGVISVSTSFGSPAPASGEGGSMAILVGIQFG